MPHQLENKGGLLHHAIASMINFANLNMVIKSYGVQLANLQSPLNEYRSLQIKQFINSDDISSTHFHAASLKISCKGGKSSLCNEQWGLSTYKKLKNIKNVRRCRDGMPKSMQTR